MEAYHTYVLSIGSNVSRANVEAAIIWLRKRFDDIKVSHVYETPAISSKGVECNAASVYDNAGSVYDNAESVYDNGSLYMTMLWHVLAVSSTLPNSKFSLRLTNLNEDAMRRLAQQALCRLISI